MDLIWFFLYYIMLLYSFIATHASLLLKVWLLWNSSSEKNNYISSGLFMWSFKSITAYRVYFPNLMCEKTLLQNRKITFAIRKVIQPWKPPLKMFQSDWREKIVQELPWSVCRSVSKQAELDEVNDNHESSDAASLWLSACSTCVTVALKCK